MPPSAPACPPSDAPRNPARRDLLQMGMGLAALGFWPSAAALAQSGLPPLEEYAPVYFTPDEWVFVLAATARLIPSEGEGPGAHEARVPVFIDLQLADEDRKSVV